MARNRKVEYRLRNEAYLDELRRQPDVHALEQGVLYKVLAKAPQESGQGARPITPTSVVTVHYRGMLTSGRLFDDSRRGDAPPAAFRVKELIPGWQIALCHMQVGDRWLIYVPWQLAYGRRTMGDIPAYSTLIFDVELIGAV